MTDTEKCEFCGRDGATRYTVITKDPFEIRAVFACDECHGRLVVPVGRAHEVLRKWASERAEVTS